MILDWHKWLMLREARRPSNNIYQQVAHTIIQSLRRNPNPAVVYSSIEKQVRAWMKKSRLQDLDAKQLTPLFKQAVMESDIPPEERQKFLTAAEAVRVQFGSLASMLGLSGLDIGDDGADEVGFTPEGGIKGSYDMNSPIDVEKETEPERRSETSVFRRDVAINNGDSLLGATRRNHRIPVWDDGLGPLWVYRNSMGVQGIVRALSWHDAHECVLDEILEPVPPDELYMAYGFESEREFQDAVAAAGDDSLDMEDGYYYQPNSTGTGIVSTDPNGDSLDRLTDRMLQDWDITLEIEPGDD